jgi:serine/threonine-protein kinase
MEAIAEAHGLGLVHRDLKPANLFLTTQPDGSGLVKVLDFGISKATEASGDGAGDARLTATSAVMGSPMYMSPEQLRSSKNVDTRTDIWALGVILYELVSGRFPFEDETVTGLCARIAADPPVPLREHRADLPPAFEAVVLRCLTKDMKDRPQTVGELAVVLRPFALPEAQLAVDRILRIGGPREARQGVASVRGGVHSTTGFADTVGATSQATTSRKGRLTTPVLAVAGLLVAVVLGGGLFVALRSAPIPVTAAPPASVTSLPSQVAVTSAPSPAAASVSAPPALVLPAAKAAALPTPTPARATARPTPTTKPPTSDDLLLDRK